MLESLAAIEDALILVVDDEAVNRRLLQSMLLRRGFRRVACASDGEAALSLINEQLPDCILLDVVMPGINGLDLCRRLRADPRFARTPIIIQTALSSPNDRRAAFAAGASDIVAKPLDPDELEARVRIHTSNALLSAGLLAYHSRMEAELGEAHALIETVLPQQELLDQIAARGLILSYAYRPCSVVGGDYWNAWVMEDGRIGLIVGDVSGHGVSAALRMFAAHTLVMPPPLFSANPQALAAHLDARLYGYGHRQAQFMAGVYGVVDPAKGVFEYIGAGLRQGFLWRSSESLVPVSMSGLPFGLIPNPPRSTRKIALPIGDVLILYSDALVECCEIKNAPHTEEELRLWMQSILPSAPPSAELGKWITDKFIDDFGDAFTDDLLIVVAEVIHASNAE